MSIVITGSGSYIPSKVAPNEGFEQHDFYGEDGAPLNRENAEIIEKFKAITGISERRYLKDNVVTSEIAAQAAEIAIEDAGIDGESSITSLWLIIMAMSSMVPSKAIRFQV